jgi:orotate phosphoribosyltransferase
MKKEEIIEEFIKCGALLEGHFILSSGLHSNKYLQCALALSDPIRAKKLSSALGKKIRESFDQEIELVVSPAMGGLIIGHEIASYLNVPFVFLEREDEDFKLRRGFSIPPKTSCLMVEDVVTTGLSSREAIKVIKDFQASVVGEACLIDRSNGNANIGVKLISLISFDIPTYKGDDLPKDLEVIPAIKPGSRNL